MLDSKVSIPQLLFKNGIIQFGVFAENGELVPYRIRLELLAAYPSLLTMIVDALIRIIPDAQFDRLATHSDANVLAGIIAQKLGISLVYSRGRGERPVYDLIGAYDSAHPTCLIVNTIDDKLPAFIKACRSVGLNVHTIVTIIASNTTIDGTTIISLFNLADIPIDLEKNSLITPQQLQAVRDYISRENKSPNQMIER